MSSVTARIEKVVSDAALEDTLNAAAFNEIQLIFDKVKGLEELVEGLTSHKEVLNKTITNNKKELDRQIDINTKLNDRLQGIEARERKSTELELEAKYSKMRVDDHIKMVELVFRNPVTSKSLRGTIPIAVEGGGNGMSGYTQQGTIDTTESTYSE